MEKFRGINMKKSKKSSMASKGLNYKLRVAFSLMTVLPLFVFTYLISIYVFPKVGLRPDIVVSMILSIFIAFLGLIVVKEIFDRFKLVSNGARNIIAGDLSYDLREAAAQDDEVGDLGNALNVLTQRIRSNMNEIKEYSVKTAEINFGMQKRVLVLSSLLQISSLISEGTKLTEVFKVIAEKARLLAHSDLSFIFYRKENQETFYLTCVDGADSEKLLEVKIEPTDDIFYKIHDCKKAIILDKENLLPADLTAFFQGKMKLHNTVLLPIRLKGRVIQFLGLANSLPNYVYSKEDIELLDIFAKQLAIAVENDILSYSVKRLEIKDSLTGLYNKEYMRNRLDEEIKRSIAYQRPCSFVLVDIDHFKPYAQTFGLLQAEAAIKNVASLIKGSVTDIDRVGRTGDDEFAVLLPEKSKRQAQEIADEIRKKIMTAYAQGQDSSKRITISAGVSENPLDGISSDELVAKAEEFLLIAKAQGRNRVVIFKER